MCTEHHYWHHDYVRLAWDSGFCFDSHKSKSNLDRSCLSIIDIEKVIKDRDVAVVEKHLNSVINYYLEPEHTKILDPTFVKVFRLSQLSVEYLQFCKRYLDNTVVVVKKELAKYKEENKCLKNFTEELKSEIDDLKDKITKLKESLHKQEITLENSNSYKCPTCLKAFVTEEYLLSHIKRRHENISFQSETDKLQLEIKELKERLNTTEKYIQSDHNLKNENILDNNKPIINDKLERVDLLLTKFEELKIFVERELSLLKSESTNDKYERWLEMVFRRLDSSKKELQNEKYDVDVLSTGDGFGERKKIDNVTQTGIIICKDVEVMTDLNEDEVKVQDKNNDNKSPSLEIDIKKIQEELYVNTENHLGQIQDVLEQKLTGGLEQIQTQINTFYEKINKLETHKVTEIKENTPIKTPIKAPIKTLNVVQQNINEEEQPQPKPRITKSLPLVKEKKKNLISKRSAPKLESKPFTKTHPVYGLSSEGYSYSSISDDEKLLLPKSSKENILKPELVGNKKEMKAKSLEVKTLYDKNLKVGSMYLESNETQEDDEEEVEVIQTPKRPSTSTLGKRSLSSLKQVGKDKQVLDGLKKELEEMVCLRLKGVGVSPAWKRLPQKSYLKAMGIIQHQMDLTTKKYPDYYKIKEKLLKKINKSLKKTTKKIIGPKSQTPKHYKSKILPKRLKPSQEIQTKSAFDTDEDTSSYRTFVTAPKELLPEDTIEPIENKTGKKKVLFDLEESTSIQKDKLKKDDKIKKLTVVKTLKKGENVMDDVIDIFPKEREGNDDSEGTTESVASLILDGTKVQSSQNVNSKGKDETSDWEISDIS